MTIKDLLSNKSEISDENTDMTDYDRLATLVNRFSLSVEYAPLGKANLLVTANQEGAPGLVHFLVQPSETFRPDKPVIFSARVDWGGRSNPLIAALPDRVEFDLIRHKDSAELVKLMQWEFTSRRCGVDSVVNRLGEVLIIRMLRALIEAGSTQPGLLAGLSDPRLSRAIVAIHDQPGHNWNNESLAAIAGLSLSRFAELFLAMVGETPAAYLRKWRLTLARQDVAKGDRINAIARRYGYRSPEGFARAFKNQFGENPMMRRPSLPIQLVSDGVVL